MMRDQATVTNPGSPGGAKTVRPDSDTSNNVMTIAGQYGVITLEWDGGYSAQSPDGGRPLEVGYKLADAADAGEGLTIRDGRCAEGAERR